MRIFHINSGGEDAAIVSWVFNLVLRVGCLGSVVIIFKSMIISLYLSSYSTAPFLDISITTMVTVKSHPLPAAVINLPEGSCQGKAIISKFQECHLSPQTCVIVVKPLPKVLKGCLIARLPLGTVNTVDL